MTSLALATHVSLQASADVSAYYEDALVRFSEDDFRGAAIQLKNALQEIPEHLPSRILLGRAHLAVGEGAAAEKELRLARFSGADPSLILVPLGRAFLLQQKYRDVIAQIVPGQRDPAIDSEILQIRGTAYFQLHETERAEVAFSAARKLTLEAEGPLVGLAQVALYRHDYSTADALVDRALSLNPDNSGSWYVKAEIARAGKDIESTIEYLNKAIEFHPGHLLARLARAETLIMLHREEEASADVETVLAFFPKDPRPLYLKAVIALRAGDADAAQKALGQAAAMMDELDPSHLRNNELNLLLTGLIAYTRGQSEKAYQQLTRYLELDPGHPGARRLVGTVLLRRGDSEEAVEVLEPAALLAPDNPHILALLGEAYAGEGRHRHAIKALEEAVRLLPKDPNIRTKLGEARLAAGQAEQAKDDFKAAMALESKLQTAGRRLAELHIQNGEFDEALEIGRGLVAAAPSEPGHYNLAGAALMGKAQWDPAREQFEQSLALDPKQLTPHFNLAELDIRSGNLTGARVRYEQALEQVPGAIAVMDKLAALAQREGNLGEAIERLEKARSLAPGARTEIIHLTGLYIQSGDTKQALVIAKALEARYPDDFAVLTSLGRAERAAGKPEHAKVTFRRMTKLAGYDSAQLYRISKLQFAIRDFEGAIWSLQKTLQKNPGFLPAKLDLVRAKMALKHFGEALQGAAQLRRDYPKRAAGSVLVGDVYMLEGNHAAAVEAYGEALEIEPTSKIAMRLHDTLKRAGKPHFAILHLEQWVLEHPNDIGAHQMLAGSYLSAGLLERAKEAHEKLIERLPNDPFVLNNLASIYQDLGEPKALELAERAHGLAPDQPAVLDTLGWILSRAGDPERALPLLRDALAREAAEPAIRYHLAATLYTLGREGEAREELEGALAKGTDFDGVEEARALLSELRSDGE